MRAVLAVVFLALVGVRGVPLLSLVPKSVSVPGRGSDSTDVTLENGVGVQSQRSKSVQRSEQREEHTRNDFAEQSQNGDSAQQYSEYSQKDRFYKADERRKETEKSGLNVGAQGLSLYEDKTHTDDKRTYYQESGSQGTMEQDQSSKSGHYAASGSSYDKTAETHDTHTEHDKKQLNLGLKGSEYSRDTGLTDSHNAAAQENGESWSESQDYSYDEGRRRLSSKKQKSAYKNTSKDSSVTSTRQQESHVNRGVLDNKGENNDQDKQDYDQDENNDFDSSDVVSSEKLQHLYEDKYLRGNGHVVSGTHAIRNLGVTREYLDALKEKANFLKRYYQASSDNAQYAQTNTAQSDSYAQDASYTQASDSYRQPANSAQSVSYAQAGNSYAQAGNAARFGSYAQAGNSAQPDSYAQAENSYAQANSAQSESYAQANSAQYDSYAQSGNAAQSESYAQAGNKAHKTTILILKNRPGADDSNVGHQSAILQNKIPSNYAYNAQNFEPHNTEFNRNTYENYRHRNYEQNDYKEREVQNGYSKGYNTDRSVNEWSNGNVNDYESQQYYENRDQNINEALYTQSNAYKWNEGRKAKNSYEYDKSDSYEINERSSDCIVDRSEYRPRYEHVELENPYNVKRKEQGIYTGQNRYDRSENYQGLGGYAQNDNWHRDDQAWTRDYVYREESKNGAEEPKTTEKAKINIGGENTPKTVGESKDNFDSGCNKEGDDEEESNAYKSSNDSNGYDDVPKSHEEYLFNEKSDETRKTRFESKVEKKSETSSSYIKKIEEDESQVANTEDETSCLDDEIDQNKNYNDESEIDNSDDRPNQHGSTDDYPDETKTADANDENISDNCKSDDSNDKDLNRSDDDSKQSSHPSHSNESLNENGKEGDSKESETNKRTNDDGSKKYKEVHKIEKSEKETHAESIFKSETRTKETKSKGVINESHSSNEKHKNKNKEEKNSSEQKKTEVNKDNHHDTGHDKTGKEGHKNGKNKHHDKGKKEHGKTDGNEHDCEK